MTTTFPLSSPPRHAGVYAIRHRVTGELYIGKTVDMLRRWSEWKSAFQIKLGVKSLLLLERIKASSPADWEFVIVLEAPGVDGEELSRLEERAIRRIKEVDPTKLLNTIEPREPAPKQPGNVALSKIKTLDGEELTQSQAAARLGISITAVKKKLRTLRSRGVYELVV